MRVAEKLDWKRLSLDPHIPFSLIDPFIFLTIIYSKLQSTFIFSSNRPTLTTTQDHCPFRRILYSTHFVCHSESRDLCCLLRPQLVLLAATIISTSVAIKWTHYRTFYRVIVGLIPVPVAVLSKAWVYGRSPAAIVGSNPTGGMNIFLLCVLFAVR
jgi:hypothetical protein